MVFMMLRCPECDEEIKVPLPDLAVGHAIRCEHCNADLVVDHYREVVDQPAVWRLQSNTLDEEERRSVG